VRKLQIRVEERVIKRCKHDLGCPVSVASPGFGASRGTKVRENNLESKGDTQKYYELHATNSDYKLYASIFLLDRQPHARSWMFRVCSFEV